MASVPFANVAGLIFGVLLVPLVLFLLVARLGTLYPRLGRWIDRWAYRKMPRLGHLFMSDEEVREERRREHLADGEAGSARSDAGSRSADAGSRSADAGSGPGASSRSAAERAFGEGDDR